MSDKKEHCDCCGFHLIEQTSFGESQSMQQDYHIYGPATPGPISLQVTVEVTNGKKYCIWCITSALKGAPPAFAHGTRFSVGDQRITDREPVKVFP